MKFTQPFRKAFICGLIITIVTIPLNFFGIYQITVLAAIFTVGALVLGLGMNFVEITDNEAGPKDQISTVLPGPNDKIIVGGEPTKSKPATQSDDTGIKVG